MKRSCEKIDNPIRWDAHGCPPSIIPLDLSLLSRYKKSGLNFISLNIGFDSIDYAQCKRIGNYIAEWVNNHNDQFQIVTDIDSLHQSHSSRKLSIAFDIEGCNVFDNDTRHIPEIHNIGVKQLGLVYNKNNSAGGGCLDIDGGVTRIGSEIIKKCNQTGIVIDCSHAGFKTSMQIMEISEQPVVFSHSNPSNLHAHPRNICDDQIRACANTSGVVGINGIGIFLGENNIRSERIVEHIDYVVQLVGPDHVGIGMDCVFNEAEMHDIAIKNPSLFPKEDGYDEISIAMPEQLPEIALLLKLRGYTITDINKILGGNFLRVATFVWK